MPNPTSLLDRIRTALRRPSPSTAQLADALADARKAEADARAAVERQVATVAAGYLDADDKRAKARAVLADLRADAEDAGLVLAEVKRRHAAALAADEQTRRRMLYDAAKVEADAAALALSKTYPALARGLVAMLRDLARAQQAVAMVNAELPAGAAPLEDPELLARSVPGLPREVVSEEEVTLWAYAESMQPLPDDRQAGIRDGGDGWGWHPGAQAPHFRRHRFVRRQVRVETRGDDPKPLAGTLQLPAVVGSGFLWEAAESWQTADADFVLARVEAADATAVARPVKVVRAVKVEWQHLGEAVPEPVEEVAPDRTRAHAPLGSRFAASPFAAPGSRPARSA